MNYQFLDWDSPNGGGETFFDHCRVAILEDRLDLSHLARLEAAIGELSEFTRLMHEVQDQLGLLMETLPTEIARKTTTLDGPPFDEPIQGELTHSLHHWYCHLTRPSYQAMSRRLWNLNGKQQEFEKGLKQLNAAYPNADHRPFLQRAKSYSQRTTPNPEVFSLKPGGNSDWNRAAHADEFGDKLDHIDTDTLWQTFERLQKRAVCGANMRQLQADMTLLTRWIGD